MFSVTDASEVFLISTDAAATRSGASSRPRTPPTSCPLRVAVRPGGCSGYSYEMFFDADIADDDVQDRARRRPGRDRPRELPAPEGRDPRLQGRPPGRRVRDQQPER